MFSAKSSSEFFFGFIVESLLIEVMLPKAAVKPRLSRQGIRGGGAQRQVLGLAS